MALVFCAGIDGLHHRFYPARWAGQRYATIAFGALLIAIYTMLGVSLYDQWYQQPVLLLLGAIWYNALTLTGHLIFPICPLQDNLARSYEQLAHYLEPKSRLFDLTLKKRVRHRFTIWHWQMAN